MLDNTHYDTRSLRDAFGRFATGVTVVTLRDAQDRPTGITVNSFSSLSLDPPLVLFSVGRAQASAACFQAQDSFTINVLSDRQEALAWQFAQPLEDKFANVLASDAGNGCAVIDSALAHFVCRKHAIHDGGDHLIVVGEVLDFGARDGDPLMFFKGQMRQMAQ